MFKLSYEEIVNKIKEEKKLNEKKIEEKIEKKLKQLSDLISREGAAHIVANELGVKLIDIEKKEFKIKDLIFGLRSVSLNGKILNKFETRHYKKENREGKVANLILGDETGSVRLVVWDNSLIDIIERSNEGDILRIRNAYCRENLGFKELHLGSQGEIEVNPKGVEIKEIGVQLSFSRKKINELKEGDFAALLGTIVQVFEPRFYEACPECNRKVSLDGDKYRCGEHGNVKERLVPVLNMFFDDGSDNIRVVAFRDNVNGILGLSYEEILKLKDEGFDEIRDRVLGKQLLINGRVNKNEMFGRLEFSINSVEEVDAKRIAEELVKEIG